MRFKLTLRAGTRIVHNITQRDEQVVRDVADTVTAAEILRLEATMERLTGYRCHVETVHLEGV